MEAKWLDGYSGQTVDQLLALSGEYRIDSIVLAFEDALGRRAQALGLGALNEVEIAVLAIEALEREVNNGGHHQFFLNTPEYAEHVVPALRRVGCTRTADIAQRAIDLLGLPGPVDTSRVSDALVHDPGGRLVEVLIEECDAPYFDEPEPIADRLFAYLSEHRERIRLPTQGI
jgi:uncharacterized protein DUF4375